MKVFFPIRKRFDRIYSSDLARCYEFGDMVLGFNGINGEWLINKSKLLRELDFGDDEGKVFDAMSSEEKDGINNFEYQAPNGERWTSSKDRLQLLVDQSQSGKSLFFTHGGSLCSWTYDKGL